MNFNIANVIADVIKPAANLVDDLSTSKEEKLILRNELKTIQNTLNEKLLNYESELIQTKASLIKSETTGNWLQRNWRPIIMLLFGFIIIYEYFFASLFSLPKSELPSDFWELLKLGMGGYVIGRSAEKIIPQFLIKTPKENI